MRALGCPPPLQVRKVAKAQGSQASIREAMMSPQWWSKGREAFGLELLPLQGPPLEATVQSAPFPLFPGGEHPGLRAFPHPEHRHRGADSAPAEGRPESLIKDVLEARHNGVHRRGTLPRRGASQLAADRRLVYGPEHPGDGRELLAGLHGAAPIKEVHEERLHVADRQRAGGCGARCLQHLLLRPEVVGHRDAAEVLLCQKALGGNLLQRHGEDGGAPSRGRPAEDGLSRGDHHHAELPPGDELSVAEPQEGGEVGVRLRSPCRGRRRDVAPDGKDAAAGQRYRRDALQPVHSDVREQEVRATGGQQRLVERPADEICVDLSDVLRPGVCRASVRPNKG
mmetsp:Transcript_37123/g.88258  ORF Transcript_37123/g.88258 Transcript_37123/m.88258 type:complete len:340 (+) Transcript_37123:167-1186(+)